MIFVDTSVWIDFFRDEDNAEVRYLTNALEEDTIAYTGMVLQELFQGISSAKKRDLVEECFEPFVEIFPSRSTYRLAGELFRKSREKGHPIRSSVDCLFSACCLEQNLEILEKDRDYLYISQISRLKRILV
jgi:predicted nucleic acid-binding protein